MEYFKLCPKCGEKQIYCCKKHLKRAMSLNKQCRKCMFNSKEYKEKHIKNSTEMWKSNREEIVKKRNTKEAKEKWRKSALKTFNTKEYKELQRKIQLKYLEEHPEKNEENKEKIKSLWNDNNSVYNSTEYRKKYIKSMLGTRYLGKTVDVGQVDLINKWNKLGFNFEINYQLHTDNLLAYLDGYDKEKNVIMEYDGKYHHSSEQKQKDLIRQNKIIDVLKPKKFWRYDAVNKQFRNVLERNS